MQGFDKGVFGGNYHTHNMIATPPGLDIVCFSNGWDWVTPAIVLFSAFYEFLCLKPNAELLCFQVRGMRHAVRQARAGRYFVSPRVQLFFGSVGQEIF